MLKGIHPLTIKRNPSKLSMQASHSPIHHRDGVKPSFNDFKHEEDEETATKLNEIKLPRPTGKDAVHQGPTEVYPWWEITLQSVDLPNQTFTTSIEMHFFWIDLNLPNQWPKYKTKEFTVHPDYVPIKMSEIFENKVSCDNSEPEFEYYESTGLILHTTLSVTNRSRPQ